MIILFKRTILNYIEKNRKIILGILICLGVGFVVGIAGYLFMDKAIILELNSYVKTSLELSKTEGYQKINVIINGIKSNFIFAFILCLASITIIGIPIIYMMYLIKGIAIGIYICILFSIFGFWNAILCILMLIIIVNMIYLPSIIYIGVNLLKFNNQLIENIREGKLLQSVIIECSKLFIGFTVIFSSIILEDIFSKIVIKIYQNLS